MEFEGSCSYKSPPRVRVMTQPISLRLILAVPQLKKNSNRFLSAGFGFAPMAVHVNSFVDTAETRYNTKDADQIKVL